MPPFRRTRAVRPLSRRAGRLAAPRGHRASAGDHAPGAPFADTTMAASTFRLAVGPPLPDSPGETDLWIERSERGLVGAEVSTRCGDYEWACLQAHQSAETALRAVLAARGRKAGPPHSVFLLVEEAARDDGSFRALLADAKPLDAAYIAIRYPNFAPGGPTPPPPLDREAARSCIRSAMSVCEAARRALAG